MKFLAKLIGYIIGGLGKSVCYIVGGILGISFIYLIIFSFSFIMQAVNNVGTYIGSYLHITFGEFVTAIFILILLASILAAMRERPRRRKKNK